MPEDAAVLRVSRVHAPVTALGPGRRVGLWVQGCSLGCHGCMARDTWDPEQSAAVPVRDVLGVILRHLDTDPSIVGLTISGGEPFEQADGLRALLEELRPATSTRREPLDVLIYSGLSWAALQRQHGALLALVDAVVPEPFLQHRAPGGRWRGSANQPLHLLSELASTRYAAADDDWGDEARPVQLVVENGRLWTIGVPAPGDLALVESLAAARGLALGHASWRPDEAPP